ncbi:MAG: GWxTD domain-containing protein [Acidobacteria bacterium]|nr:GWxTD domain-containing protein [Acidobacteriota bacterium]
MKKPIGATLLFVLTILCLPARSVSAIPKKDAWYTQHYIIMQDFERKAYRGLSADGRKAFQELFWAARTRDARAMYQARLDYVTKNFWKENSQQPWNTDRSRVYLLNGSPASIDVDQNVDFAMPLPGQMAQATNRSNEDVGANRGEVWIYPHSRYFVKYSFIFVQPSQWKVVNTGDRFRGELEDYNKNVTFGIVDLEKYKQDLAALDKKK